jgi:hypothetical protein
MIKLNNLRYSPIINSGAKEKLPDSLIYASKTNIMDVCIDKFVLFPTKENKGEKAIMQCFPEQINKEGKIVNSLYVWSLKSTKSGLGLGTRLLNFAKIHSKNLGLNGNIHLLSSSKRAPERIPHIFYRKFGMNTNDIYINHQLDKYIKEGKTATSRDFDSVLMYYPPINFQPQTSKLNTIITKFKKLLK